MVTSSQQAASVSNQPAKGEGRDTAENSLRRPAQYEETQYLDAPLKATSVPPSTPAPVPQAATVRARAVRSWGPAAATPSREPPGRASGDATTGPAYTQGQGQTQDITGPDGVKRRVRIIDPTL